MDIQDFYNGNEWNAHEYFGAHVTDEGVWFRIYAPKARKVTVIGEFNFWHDTELSCGGRGGIYSICIPDAKAGQMYKYRIYHHDGSVTDKADPYGFGMELRPCSASIIRERNQFSFTDKQWMEKTDKGYNRPIHIYEIHFGSWKANGDRWYQYEEMGDVLIPYLQEMGYTHVEILPLNEHLDSAEKYDIHVNLDGGGYKGQAEALRLAIARALVKVNPEDKSALRAEGFMTRDPRVVERKKPGRPQGRFPRICLPCAEGVSPRAI